MQIDYRHILTFAWHTFPPVISKKNMRQIKIELIVLCNIEHGKSGSDGRGVPGAPLDGSSVSPSAYP